MMERKGITVKKIVALLLVLSLLFASAFAEISLDMLDALSYAERTILKINLDIAIANKKKGAGGSNYSYQLGIDLMELSIEELQRIRDYISNQPLEDVPDTDELIGAILCDYKLFTITVTDAEIRTKKYSDDIDLILYVDIVNDNNFAYEGYIDTVTVNDWQVKKYFWFNVKGGKKQKDTIELKLAGINVFSMDDIETLSISFKLLYSKYAITTDEVELKLK